jgi:quercetin dioxygenase-like cupin family protein
MKSIVIGAACACVALSAQAQQQSSPASPFVLKEVTNNFPKADRLEARVETATLEPGKIGGWHTHPTPVVVYVIEGTLTVEIKGKDPIVTRAGEAYLEPINTVMRATNKGQTPLKFVAFQVSPPEVPDSQPAPEN